MYRSHRWSKRQHGALCILVQAFDHAPQHQGISDSRQLLDEFKRLCVQPGICTEEEFDELWTSIRRNAISYLEEMRVEKLLKGEVDATA
jgi:hypothetical protein